MSTRKAQRLQICEPVPGLQILVQLSNTLLVRTAIWVLIALLELVLDTWFFYKNLYGSSSHYLRFFLNPKYPN